METCIGTHIIEEKKEYTPEVNTDNRGQINLAQNYINIRFKESGQVGSIHKDEFNEEIHKINLIQKTTEKEKDEQNKKRRKIILRPMKKKSNKTKQQIKQRKTDHNKVGDAPT